MRKLYGGLKVEIRRSQCTDEVEIIFYRSMPDYVEIYQPGPHGWEIQSHPQGTSINFNELNNLKMSSEMAQVLSDALNTRFSPSGPTRTEAELRAVKSHLEDTRLILEQVMPSALRGKKNAT